jgi:thiol-disulfide isomerase/thioredoxin
MKFLFAFIFCVLSVVLAQTKDMNQKTFDAEVGGNKAVLVKFFAPWCGVSFAKIFKIKLKLTFISALQTISTYLGRIRRKIHQSNNC